MSDRLFLAEGVVEDAYKTAIFKALLMDDLGRQVLAAEIAHGAVSCYGDSKRARQLRRERDKLLSRYRRQMDIKERLECLS